MGVHSFLHPAPCTLLLSRGVQDYLEDFHLTHLTIWLDLFVFVKGVSTLSFYTFLSLIVSLWGLFFVLCLCQSGDLTNTKYGKRRLVWANQIQDQLKMEWRHHTQSSFPFSCSLRYLQKADLFWWREWWNITTIFICCWYYFRWTHWSVVPALRHIFHAQNKNYFMVFNIYLWKINSHQLWWKMRSK